MNGELEFHPLTPKRLPHLASLFEQGGDPKWCWCASFRVRGMDFTKARPADNRAVLEKAARTDARRGRAPGLIAYRDGEAIGWVSLAPREDFERLEHSKVLARVDEKPVWSIVCFVVGRRARGQGVANALLAAAIEYARDHGATLLEAYPTDAADGRIPSANAYMGTLSMFERAGFGEVDRRQANGSVRPRPIVRRAIRARRNA
ncbi:MAG TPA: GNAT family N-acetyltransferase [Candidatus Limnocylindrales bacterium]|nr:GNAT family N-acetyltransferase [Candidatus Limnocylindrales bacterium]